MLSVLADITGRLRHEVDNRMATTLVASGHEVSARHLRYHDEAAARGNWVAIASEMHHEPVNAIAFSLALLVAISALGQRIYRVNASR